MAIFKLYVTLLVFGIVLYALSRWKGKRQGSTRQFFIADGSLSALLTIATFLGTAFSTASIIGVPGFFYTHGIGAFWFAFGGMSLLALVGFLYGPPLLRLAQEYDTYSPIDIVSRRFNSVGLGTLVAIVTISFVTAHLTVQIVAVGRLLSALAGIEYGESLFGFVFLVIVLMYALKSGSRGVAQTDLLQGVAILVGVAVLSWFTLEEVAGSSLGLQPRQAIEAFTDFRQAVVSTDAALWSLPGPAGFFTGASLFSLIALLGSAAISQPRFSMRLMMSGGGRGLRWLPVIGLVLSLVVFSGALVMGLGGKVLFPDLGSGDEVVGRLVAEVFGLGVIGNVFALALMGAAMSTIDSQLLAVSGVITRDILKPVVGVAWDDDQELLISRRIMVIVAAVAFLISLRPPELVLELAFLALAGGMQLVPTYIGQFWSARSAAAAVVSISGGLGGMFVGRYFTPWVTFGFDPGIMPGLVIATVSYLAVLWWQWRRGAVSI